MLLQPKNSTRDHWLIRCFCFCIKEQAGESLSDCENDEAESLEEGCSKADDEEDDSEDDFMVPDGYLSEDEVSNAFLTNSLHKFFYRMVLRR